MKHSQNIQKEEKIIFDTDTYITKYTMKHYWL